MTNTENLKWDIARFQKELTDMKGLEKIVAADPTWEIYRAEMLAEINAYKTTLLEHLLQRMDELKRGVKKGKIDPAIIEAAPSKKLHDSLILRFEDNLKWREIAEILGVPETVIKKQVGRYLKSKENEHES